MSKPTTAVIRVLIVDDHPIVRKGLVFGLKTLDGIEIIGEAASGEEAIRLAGMLLPDVVLMDVSMPGMDGITATERLLAAYRRLRVLMLSSYTEPELIRAALQAGAHGYLSKDVSLDEMGRAIEMAGAGASILSDNAKRALVQNPPAQPLAITPLTTREREVHALVAAGFTNQEIADKLVISLPTARFHVSAILHKLGAANRAEAAAMGQKYNLLGEGTKTGYQAVRHI
jgi:two-component system, NarL family, response regulator LiaR